MRCVNDPVELPPGWVQIQPGELMQRYDRGYAPDYWRCNKKARRKFVGFFRDWLPIYKGWFGKPVGQIHFVVRKIKQGE